MLRDNKGWLGLLPWIQPESCGAPPIQLASGFSLNGTLARFTRPARRSNPVVVALNDQSPHPRAFSSLIRRHCDVYRAGWLERARAFENSAIRRNLADEIDFSLERGLGAPDFSTTETS